MTGPRMNNHSPTPGKAAASEAKIEKQAEQKSGASDKVQTRPPVAAAHMKRRHWGLVLSFVVLVLLPFVVLVFYMTMVARDQFASVAGFTVRQEESGGASELLGGLTALTGGGGEFGWGYPLRIHPQPGSGPICRSETWIA